MYLFRPLADGVEAVFRDRCCAAVNNVNDEEAQREPLMNGYNLEDEDDENEEEEEDQNITDESGGGGGGVCCSRQCAAYSGRVLGTAISVMFSLLFMGGVAVVVAHSLSELESGGKMQQYRAQASKLQNQTADYLTENFHMNGNRFVSQMLGSEGKAVNQVGAMLLSFMASFASNLLLVLVFLTFLLVDDQLNAGPRERESILLNKKINKELKKIKKKSCSESFWYFACCCSSPFGGKDELTIEDEREISIRQAINRSIMQYIVLKTKICALASVVVFIIFSILKVPLGGLIALVSFVLNYIPNFGPAVATLLPVPIVLLDTSLTSSQGLLAVLLPGLVHAIIGNVLEPVLFHANKDIDLHPVVLIGCILFWYILWGVPGAILAVPLTTTIKIITEKIEQNTHGLETAPRGVWAAKELLNGRVPYAEDADNM